MLSLPTDDLLHPEILSRETLITVLSQRQIKLSHSQRLDKELLVEIFHRTVTPLAQREPRENRRGKATAKKIKRLYGKRAFKLDDNKGQTDGTALNSTKEPQTGGLFISANIPSLKPRLKPPPVVINKKRGIIKLNSSSSSSSSKATSSSPDASEKKSAVVKLSSSSSPSSSSSNKVIRLSGSKSTLEGGVAKISLKSPIIASEAKKISLKRGSSELSTETTASSEQPKAATTVQSSKEDTSSSASLPTAGSPKKKLKKITWP